jgi:hypothetical protein
MRIWLALAAASIALQAMPAKAERDPNSGAPIAPDKKRPYPSPITDRFYIQGTAFDPAISTTLRVDGQSPGGGVPGRTGTVVSGEKDLGMPARKPQGRIQLMFRLRERNKLRVDYFGLSRNGNLVLGRQINFGDQIFDTGDRTTSSLDWRSFQLTYTYSFLRTANFELGTGIAVAFLESDAIGAVPLKELKQEVSGAGAFPTIPIDFTWRISRRFAFTTRAQYFKASVNGFQGSMGEYHGDFQYRWKPNFTIGAGYTRLKSSLEVNDANFPGLFRLDVRGPEFFVKASF